MQSPEMTAYHDAVDEARAPHDGPGVQVGPDDVQIQGQVLEVIGLQTRLTLRVSFQRPYSSSHRPLFCEACLQYTLDDTGIYCEKAAALGISHGALTRKVYVSLSILLTQLLVGLIASKQEMSR